MQATSRLWRSARVLRGCPEPNVSTGALQSRETPTKSVHTIVCRMKEMAENVVAASFCNSSDSNSRVASEMRSNLQSTTSCTATAQQIHHDRMNQVGIIFANAIFSADGLTKQLQ